MTHRLDKKTLQEVANISEFYDSIISEATAEAKQRTDHLMNEIKYFKTHSYEEKIYLYLVNESNEKDSLFVEARGNKFFQIDPELFSKNILPLFINKIAND